MVGMQRPKRVQESVTGRRDKPEVPFGIDLLDPYQLHTGNNIEGFFSISYKKCHRQKSAHLLLPKLSKTVVSQEADLSSCCCFARFPLFGHSSQFLLDGTRLLHKIPTLGPHFFVLVPADAERI